ncbi:MAG: helix-turn-helix domain-containing protein [Candidatus Sumerlaeaceae bacterium]|nr:helix-turn-helix domain-containing protein [Candidatus Sumerlaeaceae bacterium]
MPETLLWSIRETAAQLGGVSVRTIERMIDDGELPVIYIRKRKMIAADIVRQWLAAQNERARARMEETRPCREKTAMASTNNRGRRTGTEVIPMRTDAAAAAVRERIAKLKRGPS